MIANFELWRRVLDRQLTTNNMHAQGGLTPVALTYKCLVRLFASERHTLDVGLALYREMRGQGMAPDHVTFMALLRGLVRARDAENATLVFVDCVEAIQEQSARY